jgi:hypothetical protein
MKITGVLGLMLLVPVATGCDRPDPTQPVTEPVYAKNANNGKGGNPGSATAELSGDATSPAQTVNVVSNTSRKLELSAHESVFVNTLALSVAALAECSVDKAGVPESKLLAMLERLSDAEQNRFFSFYVDRTALNAASSDHNLGQTFTDDADGRLYTVRIGAANLLPGAGPATMSEDGAGVYTISGGAIVIADRTGGAKHHVYMACPNPNAVTVTVTGI